MFPEIPVLTQPDLTRPLTISPTDVSQFIRLDQCQRYLRLRLHERANTSGFMTEYDVAPQSIPPILTRSGAKFEETVEGDVAARYPTVHFSARQRTEDDVTHDNHGVVESVRSLAPGAVLILFQPRLQADLGPWRIRGDVDVIRLERTAGGDLQILIADMKSSTAAKVEHRLQVAFYHEMLGDILKSAGIAHQHIQMAILYRGPAENADPAVKDADVALHEAQRDEAGRLFGTSAGLLELVADPVAYVSAVHDLVIGNHSTARRVLQTPFDAIPFHLTYKCDGCLYNEFCMKRSAETDDLSLLPHLTEQDKGALIGAGISTVSDLATLKDLHKKGQVSIDGEVQDRTDLTPAPGKESLARQLATTWPVGPRIDELVHRARRYRQWKKDPIEAISWIPGKGYGSLPYSDANQNPNLIRIYIDVQHDYLFDHVYMLGALVVASEKGVESPNRRQSVVHLAEGPPESLEAEEALLLGWVAAALQAIADVAAPDPEGKPRAPIHLVFINSFAQRLLLGALGRHATKLLGATALYDFVTQLAAFDSPLSTFLDQQVKDKKNYPMICQSLQSVAAFLQFDWNAGTPYRDLFRTRLFDFWGKLDAPMTKESDAAGTGEWYTNRARFNSQIPLEFAYAAWGELPPPPAQKQDDMQPYRVATRALLEGFHARRLEAMECVAHDFAGNRQTEQSMFDLPDLANFQQKAATFAQSLDEFVTIERHVELADWKAQRLAPPEQRVLGGQTLIVRYREEDQEPGVAEQNRDNEERRLLRERYRAEYRVAHPDANQVRLPKEQKEASEWKQEGLVFRLRLETAGLACDLDEALRLTTMKAGDRFIISPRLTIDGRRPAEGQTPFTPTAKQMLYSMRCDVKRLEVRRVDGRAIEAWAEVTLGSSRGGSGGHVFNTIEERPLTPGTCYTLDSDPNNWIALWSANVTAGLVAGGQNRLYSLLTHPNPPPIVLSEASIAGQQRFLAGLDALHAAGALHDFEPSKRTFIGAHGDTPLLLVQGPPGTGKSYSTAFAMLARIQGAMAGNRDFRVFLSCKTHAATDVLLHNLRDVQEDLAKWDRDHPGIFAEYFDRRLLDIPLFRFRPRGEVQVGITGIPKDAERETGAPKATERIEGSRWCVVASTPGGIYGLIKDQWKKDLFGHHLAQCLVLDEASQMNIPEATMAALPLAQDGTLIVVGDHRQMPPIVKNDWSNEPRRTFQEFRSYESLFLSLLPLASGLIQFEESFRLHADMAEFLRREIYAQDGIKYHSNRHNLIDEHPIGDSFVAAVLSPQHPLTVVVHDEASSQQSNPFEQHLMVPILAMLSAPDLYGLKPDNGLGVVVPHRAQRAALQEGVADLNIYDDITGELLLSAVDTVERFQGDERTVILIGATESDREYLLVSGKFLLDPRRLTVALSRAKRKMILVAARSVFEVFSADEETFAHAQLWKNLLRNTCTVPLWQGDRHGTNVEVWGNPPTHSG